MKTKITSQILPLLSLMALLLSACDPPATVDNTPATNQEVEAQLLDPRDCTVRIPRHLIRGDREFDGGPLVTTMICLRVNPDRRTLAKDIYLRAEETKGDSTTVEENWVVEEEIGLDIPEGMCIARIIDPICSFLHFRAKNAGFQILGPTGDIKPLIAAGLSITGLPKEEVERLLEGIDDGAPETEQQEFSGTGPVAAIEMVVDTGGDDISTDDNEHDDMHIKCIELKPTIRVELEPCE